MRDIFRKPGPGDPAAHRRASLPLLPSGSGGVRRFLLHRARPLIVINRAPGRAIFVWRRGWDLNPRSPYEDNGFRDRPNRPLSHLSECPFYLLRQRVTWFISHTPHGLAKRCEYRSSVINILPCSSRFWIYFAFALPIAAFIYWVDTL